MKKHADLIGQDLTLNPGLVARILRSHYAQIGRAAHRRSGVDLPGFGAYSANDREGVVFTPDPGLTQHLTLDAPLPQISAATGHAQVIADETGTGLDDVTRVLRSHATLLARDLREGRTVSYPGFGKFTPDHRAGVQFTPGLTLLSIMDSGVVPPLHVPRQAARTAAQMARAIDKHADETTPQTDPNPPLQ